ncbi:hypothetical protein XBP1_1540009 [Xenorhabdus bovienii str. puntauvense]|uniref:Uncharacterized protein n=3 Tax=Xenorhabdus bovienii TaxID=40576 RepID=A0A0B6X5A2_XENBV|nr:hypothetical protein XBFFR1_1340028 [Xenorhabdus bovienii str. feltiae France]CDG92205.1 hypothetical protein XBFFL1_2030028 [Xenorhabdus bovienii str. feltiae Florida]CDG95742.1 hypothetical protein XBP1_1540009 [Xenorhabdus bovienii str. puntauvense]CDH00131.1 hypothetical protein XBFM1_1310111 [Xenorhabdus bovienii str. feltiae Moldova]CDM87888.1 protein of unknown function [Xenorhabdus bovienii]
MWRELYGNLRIYSGENVPEKLANRIVESNSGFICILKIIILLLYYDGGFSIFFVLLALRLI